MKTIFLFTNTETLKMSDALTQEIKAALEASDASLKAKFDEQSKRMTQLQDELVEVRQKGFKVPAGSMGAPGVSVKSKLTGLDGFKRFMSGDKHSGQLDLGMNIKALTSLQGSTTSPATGIDVDPQRVPGLYGVALRPTSLMEALPHMPVDSNRVEFTRLENYSSAAGYQEGEGAEKPEQDITPALVTAHIATIAVHHTASKQVLDDEQQLMRAVEALLRHGVVAKAESELIAGDGSGAMVIDGLLSQATVFTGTAGLPLVDVIGEAIATQASLGYTPNLVVLNPLDLFAIRAERADDGHYVNGAASGTDIHGLPVVTTAGLAQGSAIVLDTAQVAILDRQQPTVELSREHDGNFTKNLVTILAELRIGLAVYSPGAVYSIDLGTGA